MSFNKAEELLREFKSGNYLHGTGVLGELGFRMTGMGKRAVLIHSGFPGSDNHINIIVESIISSGIRLVSKIRGPRPNAPVDDLQEITDQLKKADPDVIVSFGGGSTLDSAKAAEVLRTLGGQIDDYFGMGLVSKKLGELQKKLTPHVAVQSASGSAAHLTKYSNITDLETSQKKLIVDPALIPDLPVFDYGVTLSASKDLTMDGALDGVSHCLEVLLGSVNSENYSKIREISLEGIRLIIENLPEAIRNPGNRLARVALGLGTDLGGYSIMEGGTSGGHLTSFSLVDILSHGRACAIMNPYYIVFFAPAVEDPLLEIGSIFKENGYIKSEIDYLRGRELGLAVSMGLMQFSKELGFPTTLMEVDGFSKVHIARALEAAKNPQLKMKLENMPVPMNQGMIDEYMGSILEAAATGNPELVKSAQ